MVAPRVAEGAPEPVRRVFCKEALCHVPDRVRNAGRLVKDQTDPVYVVQTGVGVWVLFRPQAAFYRPEPRALFQIPLNDFCQPLGGRHAGGADLEPVVVDQQRQPLSDFRPGDTAELRLAVGRHDGGGPNAGRQHPQHDP